jgi:hypothetical protein
MQTAMALVGRGRRPVRSPALDFSQLLPGLGLTILGRMPILISMNSDVEGIDSLLFLETVAELSRELME